MDDIINCHINAKADVTMVVKSCTQDNIANEKIDIIKSDENNQITDIYSAYPKAGESLDQCLHVWVINKDLLIREVTNAIAHGYDSFNHDVLGKNIGRFNMQVYKHTGFSASISSFEQYFNTSMALLNDGSIRDALFGVKERPIFTKVRNSAPTKYVGNSSVSDSLIADGCIIEGEVDNCILFRGVKIGHGAVVKNSILFQDTVVSDNVYLNCVVTDKNAVIRDGRVLSGHESMPIYVEKGKMI
jgi:glucose-1-phosphate adenylyltransferase